MDALTFSVSHILKLYEARKLSLVEIVEAVLSRTQVSNSVLNAFVLIDDEDSLRRQAVTVRFIPIFGYPLFPSYPNT